MEIGSVTSLVMVCISILSAFWAGFRFVSNGDEAIRREIGIQSDTLRREIASVQKEAALLIDKVGESEAKQRHATANNMQAVTAKLEMELRQLQREAVRLEQMQAVENRLNGALGKIEIKVDRLAESLTEIAAIKTQMAAVLTAMTRISDRLDEDNGVRRNTRVT
jgi:hypothetical protein